MFYPGLKIFYVIAKFTSPHIDLFSLVVTVLFHLKPEAAVKSSFKKLENSRFFLIAFVFFLVSLLWSPNEILVMNLFT